MTPEIIESIGLAASGVVGSFWLGKALYVIGLSLFGLSPREVHKDG